MNSVPLLDVVAFQIFAALRGVVVPSSTIEAGLPAAIVEDALADAPFAAVARLLLKLSNTMI